MITPFDDFFYLVNNVLQGRETTIADLILLTGSIVTLVAFILWSCFPAAAPIKDSKAPIHNEGKDYQLKYSQRKNDYCTIRNIQQSYHT